MYHFHEKTILSEWSWAEQIIFLKMVYIELESNFEFDEILNYVPILYPIKKCISHILMLKLGYLVDIKCALKT